MLGAGRSEIVMHIQTHFAFWFLQCINESSLLEMRESGERFVDLEGCTDGVNMQGIVSLLNDWKERGICLQQQLKHLPASAVG